MNWALKMSGHKLRISAGMKTAAFTPTVLRESRQRQILTPIILHKTPRSSISRWLPWPLWPPWPQWQRVQASSRNYSKLFYGRKKGEECVSGILFNILWHHIGPKLYFKHCYILKNKSSLLGSMMNNFNICATFLFHKKFFIMEKGLII